jgi:hypothetical protein
MAVLCNGEPVIELHLSDGFGGSWVADVTFVGSEAPEGQATIDDEEGRTMVGRFLPGRAGVLARLIRGRVVGGTGGLRKVVDAKHFIGPRVRDVLNDTLLAAGETLSPLCTPGVVNTVLPFWSRPEQTCGATVASLAQHQGVDWRVMDDGAIWVGTPEFRESESTAYTLDRIDHAGFATVAPDRLDLTIGTSFEGHDVERVQYTLENEHLRAKYWWRD